jgi:hypothetical protein
MAATVRRFDVARRAAIRACDRQGTHKGNGLLLELDDEGAIVLPCHHVIAPLPPDELWQNSMLRMTPAAQHAAE